MKTNKKPKEKKHTPSVTAEIIQSVINQPKKRTGLKHVQDSNREYIPELASDVDLARAIRVYIGEHYKHREILDILKVLPKAMLDILNTSKRINLTGIGYFDFVYRPANSFPRKNPDGTVTVVTRKPYIKPVFTFRKGRKKKLKEDLMKLLITEGKIDNSLNISTIRNPSYNIIRESINGYTEKQSSEELL